MTPSLVLRALSSAVLLVLFMATSACTGTQTRAPTPFAALEGLDLVGSLDLEDEGRLIAAILEGAISQTDLTKVPALAHGSRRMPLPQTARLGTVYVFHPTTKVDDADMALRVLPSRLENVGARILRRPKSNSDLILPIEGGPLFQLKFELQGCVGFIWNVHDRQRSMSDYLLLCVRANR